MHKLGSKTGKQAYTEPLIPDENFSSAATIFGPLDNTPEPMQVFLNLYDMGMIENFNKIRAYPLVELSQAMWIRLVDWVFHCTNVSGIQD